MTRDPFLIEGPALISFSGGRTSALMLRRILDAHGGTLPSDVHAVFANTGKERPETLDFVMECEAHWGVSVRWIEHRRNSMDDDPFVIEVDYDTASRDGFPFDQLLRIRGFLPNPTSRFCTQELKIRAMKRWMRERGYEYWTNVVGFRADEPHRVARSRAGEGKERWDHAFPLFDAGITSPEVLSIWRSGVFGFDLHLRPWEGNCDLCLLKGKQKRIRIMRDRPDLARWWLDKERDATATASKPDAALFRIDTPSYAQLYQISRQPMLPFDTIDIDGVSLDDLGDCTCTD